MRYYKWKFKKTSSCLFTDVYFGSFFMELLMSQLYHLHGAQNRIPENAANHFSYTFHHILSYTSHTSHFSVAPTPSLQNITAISRHLPRYQFLHHAILYSTCTFNFAKARPAFDPISISFEFQPRTSRPRVLPHSFHSFQRFTWTQDSYQGMNVDSPVAPT